MCCCSGDVACWSFVAKEKLAAVEAAHASEVSAMRASADARAEVEAAEAHVGVLQAAQVAAAAAAEADRSRGDLSAAESPFGRVYASVQSESSSDGEDGDVHRLTFLWTRTTLSWWSTVWWHCVTMTDDSGNTTGRRARAWVSLHFDLDGTVEMTVAHEGSSLAVRIVLRCDSFDYCGCCGCISSCISARGG